MGGGLSECVWVYMCIHLKYSALYVCESDRMRAGVEKRKAKTTERSAGPNTGARVLQYNIHLFDLTYAYGCINKYEHMCIYIYICWDEQNEHHFVYTKHETFWYAKHHTGLYNPQL